MANVNPKEKHYWTQLRAVLTAGSWTSELPGKAPNAAPLSWPELRRKFNKHCTGYADIAEIALHTRTLVLLLGSNLDEDHDNLDDNTIWPISLGDTSLLAEEYKEEATGLYDALQKLETARGDTLNLTLAYFAYALGNFEACIGHVDKVSDLLDVPGRIPNSASCSTTNSLQLPTSSTYGSSSASWTGSFISDHTMTTQPNMPDVIDGKAWSLTENIRSICLKGMSMEKLYPDQPQKAMEVYNIALPLLIFALTQMEWIASSTSTLSNASGPGSAAFSSTREVWRWVERLIWRAVVLSSKTQNLYDIGKNEGLWTWLEQYSSCSTRWPPTFRPRHRSTVCALYMRALVLGSSQYSAAKSSYDWFSTSRAMVHEYRAILNTSTKFPKAGDRNIKVEDFVDLCVGVWEAGGSLNDQAAWVVDVLWWGTRLTFNCPRIFRHMFRLCQASGDTNLARRFLNLYVQVVGKHFQTQEADVEIEGMESDEQWIDTLCQGARMLSRLTAADKDEVIEGPEAAGRSPTHFAVDDARLARELVHKARSRLGEKGMNLDEEGHERWEHLRSQIDLADGVANSVLALKEQCSLSRPGLLAKAHQYLLTAVSPPAASASFKPTAATHFHLALSHTRPGPMLSLDQAVVHAGLAVEGEPKEVRYWHLLGLVLAAKELWDEASDAFERGAALGEKAFSEEDGDMRHTYPHTNGAEPEDSDEKNLWSADGEANKDGVDKRAPRTLLTGEDLPPTSLLLGPLPDFPPPSKTEALEYALQVRMSQLALIEHVGGTELAEARGIEIFQWMSKTKRSATPQRKSSLASRVSTAPSEMEKTITPSNIPPAQGVQEHVDNGVDNTVMPPLPLSINVRPASPGHVEEPRPLPGVGAEDLHEFDEADSELVVGGRESTDSRSKKVQKMLKEGVHKGQATIKKIGSEVARTGHLKRSLSSPDFHALLRTHSYQASSIHSRRRVPSIAHTIDSPLYPSPPPPIIPAEKQTSVRSTKEQRMLSNLWLMSAATFRRAGKIEQARGAIQEAEVADESNPLVWDQLGLYYLALGHDLHAVDTFQKALFIAPDCVPAVIHLAQTYLTRPGASRTKVDKVHPDFVDLAAGMLRYWTSGIAWDVPEAWYFLAKAYEMQGRKANQRECLATALKLAESRGVREIGTALGWCI